MRINNCIEHFSAAPISMLVINALTTNAVLFASLLLVIGVPVLYMTQSDPSDRRNGNIKRIEILGGVWFHLVLANGAIAGLV